MAYYPAPLSLDPMPPHLRPGLIIISCSALLSLTSTACAVAFIFYMLSNTKRPQTAPLRYNQSLILILNLLIADFQQALSFSLSLHWIRYNAILAPTTACTAQGWLVQIGDVSSGLFSLSIASHTFYILVMHKTLPQKTFSWLVVGIWCFAVGVSLISPLIHRDGELFVSAGAWCWISEKYHNERLFVHYIWIFICEFGSLLLYAVIFVVLQRKTRHNAAFGVHNRTTQRVARLMLVYPIAYTLLTLPLASFRMATQSGMKLGDIPLLVAGACMASCGWVDVILYMVTRRTIVSLHQHSSGSRHTGTERGTNSEGLNDIPMTSSLPYGNSTVVGGGMTRDSDSHGVISVNSSQEGFVKMEQVVQVTVEDATESERAAPAAEPKGEVIATSYW